MAMASSSTRATPLCFLPSILLSLLLLLAFSHTAAAAAPNTLVCNPNSYGDDSPFAANLEELLEDLVFLTPWIGSGPDVYNALPSEAPIVYGHAVCRPGLGGDNCQQCLGFAATMIQNICGHSLGGRSMQADDCRVRYEQYAFTD